MVQYIKASRNPKEEAKSYLAAALGQGLGTAVLSHFADKALDDLIADPENANLSQVERLEKTRSLLSRYGKPGQDIFKKRIEIEKVAAEENKIKQQQKTDKAKSNAMQKVVKGEELSPEEIGLFNANEQLSIAKFTDNRNKEKAPIGGLGGMAVPPEQADIIEDIEEANPNATADELENLYNKAGVYPAYIHEKLETKRQKEKREAELGQKDLESEFKAAKEFHDTSKDFAESVRKGAETGKKQFRIVNDIIKNVESDKIKPTDFANILRFFGKTGEKLSHAFLTKEQAEMISAIPEFLEGRKEMFGIRLSDADLKLLQDKLPDFGKSKEANLQILGLLRKYSSQSILKQEAAEYVKEHEGYKTKFGNLRPLDFEEKVDKKFDEFIGEEENGVKMIDHLGNIVMVERSKVETAKKKYRLMRLGPVKE